MYFSALAVLTISALQAFPFAHSTPLGNGGATDYTEDLIVAERIASIPAIPANPRDDPIQTGGFATLYAQHNTAGACGTVHEDTDLVAAIDAERYGDLGEVSYLCGMEVQITNTNNGQSVVVTIADACPTCLNGNSIDLSISAFETIATYDEGIVPIEWFFL